MHGPQEIRRLPRSRCDAAPVSSRPVREGNLTHGRVDVARENSDLDPVCFYSGRKVAQLSESRRFSAWIGRLGPGFAEAFRLKKARPG